MTVIFGRNRHITVPAMTGARVFSHHGGASGNGLLNALIAYWPGDETSGNLLDAHTNGLNLTDTNTVTYAAGKVYSNARQYTAGNTEYHRRDGDDALLSTGDVDFTVATWINFASVSSQMDFVSKMGGTQNEYMLYLSSSTNRIRLYVYTNTDLYASNAAADGITTGVWYFAVGWHDATANTINFQLNNGTVYSTDTGGNAPADSNGIFCVGQSRGGSFMDGRIGPAMFWKSSAGNGGVLTEAQRTALYNGGDGLAYASFTA